MVGTAMGLLKLQGGLLKTVTGYALALLSVVDNTLLTVLSSSCVLVTAARLVLGGVNDDV